MNRAGEPNKQSNRIASDTSLNRMASLPNLRAQATTPVYGQFPQDATRVLGTHLKYTTATPESRYTPGARYEQVPIQHIHEYDVERSENAPGSGFATPDMGYSPFVPAPVPAPGRSYSPYTPPVSAPAAASDPPMETSEVPEEQEDMNSRREEDTKEAGKSTKDKDKDKETEKDNDNDNDNDNDKKGQAMFKLYTHF